MYYQKTKTEVETGFIIVILLYTCYFLAYTTGWAREMGGEVNSIYFLYSAAGMLLRLAGIPLLLVLARLMRVFLELCDNMQTMVLGQSIIALGVNEEFATFSKESAMQRGE